jgi:hypothetical protein
MVPAVSGISLPQQANAATNGQNGRPGTNECSTGSTCDVGGGKGGSGNGVSNLGYQTNPL